MSSGTPSAREVILAAVRAARPPAAPLPETYRAPERAAAALSRADAFIAAATAAGAAAVVATTRDVARIVTGVIGAPTSVLSYAEGVSSTFASHGDGHVLDALDVLVCESTLGVAENGAVWLATSDTVLRAALFLAARVVIVIAERDLVDDLHEAYERIDVRSHSFGAFIAGPSKTADIEQALVIGAHGPKELTLVVVKGAA